MFSSFELAQTIQKTFGIVPTDLQPLNTEGEVGQHYLVVAGEVRYFLKVYPDTFIGRICESRLNFFADRTWHLSHIHKLGSILAPLKTLRGDFEARHEGRPFLLFDHVSGGTFEDRNKDIPEEVAKLVSLVAEAHDAGSKLDGAGKHDDPLFEQLDAYVRDSLAEAGISSLDELRESVLANKEKVLALLAKAQGFREAGRLESKPAVFCHGDLNPWNIMVEPNGGLRIIDWDFACFAPLERDLFIFCASPHFKMRLEAYEKVRGPIKVSLNLLNYYMYLFELGIGMDRIQKMLHEARTEEEVKKYMGHLRDTWFQDFDELDRKLALAGEMLKETHRLID